MIPVYFAILIYGLMAHGTASVILKGGCGKNGSTVAVRKILKKKYLSIFLSRVKFLFNLFFGQKKRINL